MTKSSTYLPLTKPVTSNEEAKFFKELSTYFEDEVEQQIGDVDYVKHEVQEVPSSTLEETSTAIFAKNYFQEHEGVPFRSASTRNKAKRQLKSSFAASRRDSRKVNHFYIDYAFGRTGDDFEGNHHCVVGESDSRKSKGRESSSRKGEFPTKLMMMLIEAHYFFSDIICWRPHGRAFRVENSRKFEHEILSSFFKMTQISSFRKQLSLWGFKRITQGIDNGSYYHPRFLRGMPQLMKTMSCTKVKGIGKALIPNPDDEPNFMKHRSLPYLPLEWPYSSKPKCVKSVIEYERIKRMRSCSYEPYPYNSSSTSYDPYVTEEEDPSIAEITPDELNSIYSQMSFPAPFRPPSPVLTIKSSSDPHGISELTRKRTQNPTR